MKRAEYFKKIYELVSQIPPGRVATYGQLAYLAGFPQAPRIAGQALCFAPPGLPCHRCVNSEGRLFPAARPAGKRGRPLSPKRLCRFKKTPLGSFLLLALGFPFKKSASPLFFYFLRTSCCLQKSFCSFFYTERAARSAFFPSCSKNFMDPLYFIMLIC